jgi:hypothetical protein
MEDGPKNLGKHPEGKWETYDLMINQ